MNFQHRVAQITLFGLTALFFSSLAQAQQEGEVHLQFLSFPKAADPGDVELYLGEGKTLKVEIPTNRVSRNYTVKPMEKWILGESVKAADDKTIFKPFGQAASISSKRQLILVIRKSRNNEDGLALIPMPNTDLKFGGGSFFFMNATSLDIAGIVSDQKFVLKPGKFTVIEPNPSETKGVYKYCKAQLLYRKGDEVRSFFNTTWRLNDKARSLIFFYQTPDTDKIRLHSIRDYL